MQRRIIYDNMIKDGWQSDYNLFYGTIISKFAFGFEKTDKTEGSIVWYLGWDWNLGFPEYEAGIPNHDSNT
jgi:hypothetical protein